MRSILGLTDRMRRAAAEAGAVSRPSELHVRGEPLPPLLPGAVPVLGHALELRRDPVGLLQRGRDRFGDLFRIQLPGSPHTVVMTGPVAQQHYFRLTDQQVSMREVYRLMTPIFGKGIAYDAEPEVMREQLGFFHETLRDANLRTYVAGFVEEAEQYFGRWGSEGVVDLYEAGNELTIYTSSRALLGADFRRRLSDEFARLYYDMEEGLQLLAFFAPNLPTPAFRRRDRARARLGELIANIVRERRAEGTRSDDFLQALMDARYADGRAVTEDEMTGLLLAIMFAGHHTSGVTFAWTGILLHQFPHVIAPLLAEQRAVLGDRTTVTLDDLRAMTLLEATIKEVLRLYPPIILMMRRLLESFDFGGYHVPQGAMLVSSPAVAHRLPHVFREPDRFDPTRFLPPRAEDRAHPFGFIAFGGGRHRCMGIVFAQLQLRALWSHLLRNFEFELLEGRYEPDYSRMLVGPRKPCRVRFRRRSA
jgi:sterol 14-demethylase